MSEENGEPPDHFASHDPKDDATLHWNRKQPKRSIATFKDGHDPAGQIISQSSKSDKNLLAEQMLRLGTAGFRRERRVTLSMRIFFVPTGRMTGNSELTVVTRRTNLMA